MYLLQLCQVTLAEIQQQLKDGTCDGGHLLDLAASVILCASTRETNSSQSTAATAFCCSLFSHVLYTFADLFNVDVGQQRQEENPVADSQQEEQNASEEEDDDEEETKRAKLRRRKIVTEESDNELSEEDFSIDSDTDDTEEDSDNDESKSDSGFHSAETRAELPPLELPPPSIALLPLFKAMTDWFRANPQIIRVSSQSVRKMWIALAKILNELRRCQRDDAESFRRSPLPEDWKFYGLASFNGIHSEIGFDGSAPVPQPASTISTSIRIERILSFGSWLVEQSVSGFRCDDGVFSCSTDEGLDLNAAKEEEKKADLMKNMAHLWLKSEVQDLERKLSPQPVRRRSNKKSATNWDLSHLPFVFVVPDVAALMNSTQLIKQIVKSQKLIVVIPDVVISEMDLLKVRSCQMFLPNQYSQMQNIVFL